MADHHATAPSQLIATSPIDPREVGAATGRIAHDLNNQLTVILANVMMLIEDPGDEGEALLAEIAHAAQRSAGLSASLLAYATRHGFRGAPSALPPSGTETTAPPMRVAA